jgi:hypothetical protein
MKNVLYWTPRVLGLAFAAFISLFALDVFGAYPSIGETVLALLIHLVPTYLILAALVIAWRWERIGALAFAALGLAYVIMAWGDMHWSAFILIAGPPILIAAAFLADSVFRRRHAAL